LELNVPNLRELIQDVNSVLDYNPDLEAYKAQTARAINRHYLQISGQFPWLFLVKEWEIDLYAPVEGSSGISVVRDGANPRKVVGTGTSFHSGMDGQTIAIDGNEYTILRVEDSTHLYTGTPVTTAASTEDWSITFLLYPLPYECGEPLSFSSRDDDRGRLLFFNALKEEIHFLDKDDSGDPIIIIESPHQTTQSPELPPLAAASAGGSLLASKTYQYMYTVTEYGREGPPSTVAEATTTAANKTITLSNLTNLDYGGNYTGRTRKIYRRNKTDEGRFLLIDEQNTSGAGTTYIDNGSVTTTFSAQTFRERGHRQYIRPWSTPGADIAIVMRYQSVPEQLQSDSDAPEWPPQFHHLLVYRAIQDAAAQHGMTAFATMYERRANELLWMMRQRWLTRTARDYIRRGFDANLPMNHGRRRFGSPTKT